MAEFSDFLENKIIDHFLRNSTATPSTAIYLALFTSSTGLESNLPTAEITGGAYARVAITASTAAGGASANTNTITFATATATWGTISHIAIVDHATQVAWGTSVNVLMWTPVDATKLIETNDIAQVPIGDLDITVD